MIAICGMFFQCYCIHGFFPQARTQTACTLIEKIGKHRGELVKNMQLLCEAYIELAYVNVTQLKNERGTIRPAGIEQPIALYIMYLFHVKFKLNNYDGSYLFLSSPALWQMFPLHFNLFSKPLTPTKY